MFTPLIRRTHLRTLITLLMTLSIVAAFLPKPVSQATSSTAHPVSPATNVDDPQDFVRQHYLDFLNREPDAAGLAFWTNEITSCGSDAQCVEVKRINVSAAFFLSIEFQRTGYLVYRLYQAAYATGERLPLPLFRADTRAIGKGVIVGQAGWEQRLEENKQAFLTDFCSRDLFTSAYPGTMPATEFVDALNTNTGGSLSPAERDAMIIGLQSGSNTRAQVLRAIAEDSDFVQKEFNKAFVLMQYFGYLRREPNDFPDTNFDGLNFWLAKLNQFNGNFIEAEMVKAFIASTEYRDRFSGPKFTLYTNLNDPLLLRAELPGDEVVDYYGTRDSEGTPTRLTSSRVEWVDGRVAWLEFDDLARVSQFVAPGGVVFKYNYLSGTNAELEITAPGGQRVRVPFALNTSTAGSALDSFSQANASNGVAEVEAPFNSHRIDVSRCGKPSDEAMVEMVVTPAPAGIFNDVRFFPAQRIPGVKGAYQVKIPGADPNAGSRAESQCRAVQGVVKDLSSSQVVALIPTLCPVIAAAIALIPGGLISAAAVFEACTLEAAALAATLKTFPWSGALGLLCDNIAQKVNRELNNQLFRLRPRASGIPRVDGFAFGDVQLIRPSDVGPFPPFKINGDDTDNADGCVATVEIDPSSALMSEGENLQLRPIARNAKGQVVPTTPENYIWTTTNQAVGTVDGTGRVSALDMGTTQVRAREKLSEKDGIASLTVKGLAGNYSGSNIGQASGCSDEDENGGFSFATIVQVNKPVLVNGIGTVSGRIIVKNAIGDPPSIDLVLEFDAVVGAPGAVRTLSGGTIRVISPAAAIGSGAFTGQWSRGANGQPDQLVLNYQASGVAFGVGCFVSGSVTASRQ